MIKNNEKLKNVLDLSLKNVNLSNKILKALEELGELSRVHLKLNKSANSTDGLSKSENSLQDELLEESLDIYLVVLDIINTIKNEYNFSEEDIDNILNKKIDKWFRKFEK